MARRLAGARGRRVSSPTVQDQVNAIAHVRHDVERHVISPTGTSRAIGDNVVRLYVPVSHSVQHGTLGWSAGI